MRLLGWELFTPGRARQLHETVTELSRRLEDVTWTNIGNPGFGNQNMLPGGVNLFELIAQCRRSWYVNPLAGLWDLLHTSFIFGGGLAMPKAQDPAYQKVLEAFWEDEDNKLTLTSPEAQWRLSSKSLYEGNLFLVLHTNPATGQVKVRLADTATIIDVITSEEDQARRLAYRRRMARSRFDFRQMIRVSDTPKDQFYPDISVAEPEALGIPADRMAKDARILHVRLNCDPNDRYGVPPLLRGLDWIKTHKSMANDFANLVASLARFAWKKKFQGSPAQVAAAKTFASAKTDQSNPASVAGATWIGNAGVDLEPVNTPTGGGPLHREALRSMILQVAAAAGMGEQYFGDPSTGNLATAKTMELPLLRSMQMRQQFWTGVYDQVCRYVRDQAIIAGELPGEVELLPEENRYKVTPSFEAKVDLDFPNLTEEDLVPYVDAVSKAVEANLIPFEEGARLVMIAMKINDIEAQIKIAKAEKDATIAREDEAAARDAELQKDVDANAIANKARFAPEPAKTNGNGAKPAKEAIEIPERGKADRMADKRGRLLGKMEAYRRSIAGAWRLFGRRMEERMELVGPEGSQSIRIRDLRDALGKLLDDMQHSATVFFPQAIDLGSGYVRAHLPPEKLTEAKANGTAWLAEVATDELLAKALRWNRQYLEDSLLPDLLAGFDGLTGELVASRGLASGILAEKLGSFEARVGMYASALWAVEEQAVAEIGKEHDLKVNFVGADDKSTCESCTAGMAGNPWPIGEAPKPGLDTICRTNCRHALQILERAKEGATA